MTQPVFDIVRSTPAPTPEAAPRPETSEILGIPLALTNYDRTMDWMDGLVSTREKAYLSAAAV